MPNNDADDRRQAEPLVSVAETEKADATGATGVATVKTTIPVVLGVVMKDGRSLSKRIFLGPDGMPVSDASNCFMINGAVARIEVAFPHDLPRLLTGLPRNCALTLGVPEERRDGVVTPIILKDQARTGAFPGMASRSLDYFRFEPDKPGLILFDTDFKGISPEVRAKIEAAGGSWAAIEQVMPGLSGAARARRLSTSAGLSANGVTFPHSGGEHSYILAKDGTDIPRATRTAHQRMTLAGFGWSYVGKGGQVLHRSPVDAIVGSPERLVFEGAPIVVPPLVQEPRIAEAIDGVAIDTRIAIPDLDESEQRSLAGMLGQRRAALRGEAERVRTTRDRKIAVKMAKKTSRPVREIMRELATRHNGRLPPVQPLQFDDRAIGTVTVGDVLADPEKYIGQTLRDPIEPEYGPCKAKLFRGQHGDLIIHSFAHGKNIFVLSAVDMDVLGPMIAGLSDVEAESEDDNTRSGDGAEEADGGENGDGAEGAAAGGDGDGANRNREHRRRQVRYTDLVGHAPSGKFIHRPTLELWPPATVDKVLPKVNTGILNDNQRPNLIAASTYIMRTNRVEQLSWIPGKPEIIEDAVVRESGVIQCRGMRVYNQYRAPAPALGDPVKAEPWLAHVRRVFPEPGDADHIIRYLAHPVQFPGVKINHSLLLGGAPGIGKDTILVPLRYAVGEWNSVEIKPSDVFGQFNKFMKTVLLRISEVHDLGTDSMYSFYERMKALQTSPPDTIRINEKNLGEYHIANVAAIVMTTNHRENGLYLPADDRRHYIAWSPLAENEPGVAYFDDMYDWFRAEGNRHVAAYLRQLDLSGFNENAPPAKTAAFWVMVNANRSAGESGIGDIIAAMTEKNGTPPDILTVQDLLDFIIPGRFLDVREWLRDPKHRRTIPVHLERNGYVAAPNPDVAEGRWRLDGRKQMIYRRNDLLPREAMQAKLARAARTTTTVVEELAEKLKEGIGDTAKTPKQ